MGEEGPRHRGGTARADMERQAVWGTAPGKGAKAEAEPDLCFRSTT